jgi:uncharacterized protein DUF4241
MRSATEGGAARVDVPERPLVEGDLYEGQFVVQRRQIGSLVLPTGRLVAVDPLMFGERGDAFAETLPAGSYPVFCWWIWPPQSPAARVLALEVVVRDTPAVEWVSAAPEHGADQKLEEGEFWGYGVDTGLGCFYDASVAHVVGSERERIQAEINTVDEPDDSCFDVLLDGRTGANLIGAATAHGDGFYYTWLGRDATGSAVSFCTDFRD